MLSCCAACHVQEQIKPSTDAGECLWGRVELHDHTLEFHPYANCPGELWVIKPNITYLMRRQYFNEIHWPRYVGQDQTIYITNGIDTCSFFVPGTPLPVASDSCTIGGFEYDGGWQWAGEYPVQFRFIGINGPGQTISPDSCWSLAAISSKEVEVWSGTDTCWFELPEVPQS